jgi:transcriptional regulator with XRE-family HTH domain
MKNIIPTQSPNYEKIAIERVHLEMADKDIVRRMRKGHGLTLAVLAKETKMSLSKLSRWENAKAKLTPAELETVMGVIDRAIMRKTENVPGPLQDYNGPAVKQLRRAYGISQVELAARADIAQSSLSLLENGYVTFEPKELQALKAALDFLVKRRKAILPETVKLQSLLAPRKPVKRDLETQVAELQEIRELQAKQISSLTKRCMDEEEISTLRHAQIEGLKEKLLKLGVGPEEIEELLNDPGAVREHQSGD